MGKSKVLGEIKQKMLLLREIKEAFPAECSAGCCVMRKAGGCITLFLMRWLFGPQTNLRCGMYIPVLDVFPLFEQLRLRRCHRCSRLLLLRLLLCIVLSPHSINHQPTPRRHFVQLNFPGHLDIHRTVASSKLKLCPFLFPRLASSVA